jgi:hypothetical protein
LDGTARRAVHSFAHDGKVALSVDPPMLERFLLVLGVLALVLAGCGSARSHVEGPGLSGWESQMLGAKPDAYFVLRMDKALADPVYGGPRTPFDPPENAENPELEAFLRSVNGIEAWLVADALDRDRSSILMVVRGHPSLDALKKQDKEGKIKWRTPERLPSGAVFHDLSDEKTNGALVVLPSGTWVGVTGPITGRVRYHFFSTASDPPPSSYEPDALLALWIGPGASKLAGKSDKETSSDLGLVGGGIVLRSSKSGDMDLSATFADDAHAERALATVTALAALVPTLRRELTNRCPAWEKVQFDLQRDGKTITGRMSNLPPLVRAYRLGACRYDAR